MQTTVFVSSVEVKQSFVKRLKVQCMQSKSVIDTKAQYAEVSLQPKYDKDQSLLSIVHELKFNGEPTDSVKIEILEAFEEFCILHGVTVYGETQDEDQ